MNLVNLHGANANPMLTPMLSYIYKKLVFLDALEESSDMVVEAVARFPT